jgi:protein CpxP
MMTIKNKILSVFTLILGVAIFSTAVVAQDSTTERAGKNKADKTYKRDGAAGKRGMGRGGFKGDRMKGRMGGMHLRGLDLTDAQKIQIKAIREANRADEAVMMEMRTLRKAKFEGTITAEQNARMTMLRDQQIAKMRSVRDQINNVLTAEQRAKIEERKQMREQRFQERMEKRKAAKGATPKVS